jgi:dihydrofolate reductase
MKLSLIVAMAENGIIGRDGELPWHLSADLRRFKRLTMGHAILMGRKTWESIGRVLPGRTAIVITHGGDYQPGDDKTLVATSLDDALHKATRADCEQDQFFIIGGGTIYELALPRAERIYLTRVHAHVEGDVSFPAVDWQQWQLKEQSQHTADTLNDYAYTFEMYERVKS